MATETFTPKNLWLDNDEGPFRTESHTLVLGGPGKQSIRVNMRDRDIMVCVSVDESTLRLLHLQNVRSDNAEQARATVKELLDELKSLDDSKKPLEERPGYIKYEHATDEAHEDVRSFVVAQAEERGLGIEWDEGGYSRYALRQASQQLWFKLSWSKDGSWSTDSGTRFPMEQSEDSSKTVGK